MLKVVAFMKRETLVLHTFIAAVSMPLLLIMGKGILHLMK